MSHEKDRPTSATKRGGKVAAEPNRRAPIRLHLAHQLSTTRPHYTTAYAQQYRRWLGFHHCCCCCCSSRVSMAHPCLRPPAALYHHPTAAARGIDDLSPTAALAVALAAVDHFQRHDVDDDLGEDSSYVKHTRCSRKRRATTKQIPTHFRLPYPRTPSYQTTSEIRQNNEKNDPTDDRKTRGGPEKIPSNKG